MCVSTLKQTSWSSSNRTTPALSAKTLTSQSRPSSWVASKIVCFSRLSIDLALELDPPPEGLVRAVLAPGLGEGLQLAVGRVAAQLARNGPGSSASRRGSARAGRPGWSAPGPRRPSIGSATSISSNWYELPLAELVDLKRALVRPARPRRWPARGGSAGEAARPGPRSGTTGCSARRRPRSRGRGAGPARFPPRGR